MKEYIDARFEITVKELPLFSRENPLFLKDILTIKGIQNIELKEAINLIQFSLIEIIDLLIKKALSSIVDIDYYIIGGKALNNIIKLKYLSKSFNFDILVTNVDSVTLMGQQIRDECFEQLNLPYNQMLRYQIYKKLLLLNLVDETLEKYYMSNDTHLIFYGNRHYREYINRKTSGLFIKLKLRKNLFKYDEKDINYTNYLDTKLTRDDLVDAGVDNNILYIPIATFLHNNDPLYITFYTYDNIYNNPFENINYADFSYILLFLLILSATEYTETKRELYIKKLNMLNKPLYYNCNMYYEYNSLEKFKTMYQKIMRYLKYYKDQIIYDFFTTEQKKLIDDNMISDVDQFTTYGSFIEKLVNKIINTQKFYQENCKVVLGESSEENKIFLDNVDPSEQKRLLNVLHDVIKKLDQDKKYVFKYTQKLYQNLNIYCNYFYNDISTDSYTDEDYIDVIYTINSIYEEYHKNDSVKTIKKKLKPYFYIYSSQLITNFTQIGKLATRSFIDLSYIKQGDIIQINQYLSGTFNSNFDFSFFNSYIPSNRIFFKIKINKFYKNWIILDTYSEASHETEILLKQNSIFFIESIDYQVVDITVGKKKEYKIITLELCDPGVGMYKLITQKLLKLYGFNKFDNILKAPLFIKSLKHVYNTYFKKPYKESSLCEPFKMEDKMEVTIVDNMRQSSKFSIYRYNHALAHTVRVTCWIQLLYLQDRLYNELDTNTYDQKFLMKTCIASLFMISGRESEVGFDTLHSIGVTQEQLKELCPDVEPDAYQRYLAESAKNFEKYIKLLAEVAIVLDIVEDQPSFEEVIRVVKMFENITLIFIGYDPEGRMVFSAPDSKKAEHLVNLNSARILLLTIFVKKKVTFVYRDLERLPLFTEEDIEDYKYCLEYYYYIDTETEKTIKRISNSTAPIPFEIHNDSDNRRNKRKKIAKYFTIARTHDLIRCHPTVSVKTILPKKHHYYDKELTINAKLVYDIVKNTGDRISSTNLKKDDGIVKNLKSSGHNPDEFYLCSTNPEYCITNVLNTTDTYFNQLIYALEEKEAEAADLLEKKNDFKLDDIIPIDDIDSPPPLQEGGTNPKIVKSQPSSFIFDDSNDMESINLQVNNSNLGSTYYMSSKSYDEIMKNTKMTNLFLENGIYCQNIYTSFNKKVTDEQSILFKKPAPRQIYEYEKKLYPQYFYRIEPFTDEEKKIYSISYEQAILNIINKQPIKQTHKNFPLKLKGAGPDPDSVMDFKSKYLKYKNKYLELKNKLNL